MSKNGLVGRVVSQARQRTPFSIRAECEGVFVLVKRQSVSPTRKLDCCVSSLQYETYVRTFEVQINYTMSQSQF